MDAPSVLAKRIFCACLLGTLIFSNGSGQCADAQGAQDRPPVVVTDEGVPSSRLWELINVGNGYFQIRLKSPDSIPGQCLGVDRKTNTITLLDCSLTASKSGEWSFDRLVSGGYQVLNRWSAFYQRPACLSHASSAVTLLACRYGEGVADPLAGVAKLYADPTVP